MLIPLAQKILDGTKSAVELFHKQEIVITIYGKKDLLNIGNKELLVFRNLDGLNLNELTEQDKLIIEKANNYSFLYMLSNINRNYSMRDIRIHISENISFEDMFYVFNKKEYFYGNFPFQSDINSRIQEIKQDVLHKIKNAMV